MRIGIFSGSFDPIHCGHAMMANYLSQFCGLDKVWLMPSPLNPLKKDAPPADFSHRFAMSALVASKCENVEVSDFECSLPSPSYTYRTLYALKESYPQHEFVLIIGSDNLVNLSKWKDPEKIISEFGLIVYPRPGFEIPDNEVPKTNVVLLKEAPLALISSTFIRKACKEGKNLNYFLDSDVVEYIKEHHLYR